MGNDELVNEVPEFEPVPLDPRLESVRNVVASNAAVERWRAEQHRRVLVEAPKREMEARRRQLEYQMAQGLALIPRQDWDLFEEVVDPAEPDPDIDMVLQRLANEDRTRKIDDARWDFGDNPERMKIWLAFRGIDYTPPMIFDAVDEGPDVDDPFGTDPAALRPNQRGGQSR